MSLRQNWKFSYTACIVGDAAKKKKEYHQERCAFWTAEKEKAAEDLKINGVQIREYEGSVYSNKTNNVGMDVQVIADPTKQQRLSDCTRKAQEHYDTAKLYQSFEKALIGNFNATVELDVTDIEFFGLYSD